MKSTRTSLLFLLLAVSYAPLAILNAQISEQDLGSYKRPKDKTGQNHVTKQAKGIVAEIANTPSFKKWKNFEDDKIKFSYPDHKSITVEATRNEPVPVGGDRVSSVDTSFSRAYRITADGQTLLVLMLRKADWLDDGICFCGAVIYERYLIRNGNLYRFSFLENGILKKMQVLGDGERMMMFEWTHLPLHPAVYRQIARSIELKKKGSWTEKDSSKRILQKYGPEDAVGWFDQGSSVELVKQVLGKPNKITSDGIHTWEYPKTEDGHQWTEQLSLPFAEGKLLQFDSDFYDSAWDKREAIKGGIPWMLQTAEPYEDPSEKKMPEPLKTELLALFLEKSKDQKADFEQLCQVLWILVKQGVKDDNALNIVRKKFATQSDHYAAWVLHEAGHPQDISLFIEKVSQAYKEAEANLQQEYILSDLHNWLAFIPNDHAQYPALLRNGLKNPNPYIRESTYYFLDSAPFPKKELKEFVHNGLLDPSERVRFWSIRYYAKENMSKPDWELLRNAAELEKNEENLKEIKKLLKANNAK